MPNCFCLHPKANPAEAAILQTVDEEICRHFNVPVDPVKYVCGWYDSIGFRVAMGRSFPQIRNEFLELAKTEKAQLGSDSLYNSLIAILDFLDEKYTTDAWAEIGRS